MATGEALGQLRRARALLRGALCALSTEPGDEVQGDAVVSLARLFADLSKLSHAGTVRCAQLAGDEGARRFGGEKSAASLLSGLSGTTIAKARAALGVADQLSSSALTERAFLAGELSNDQAAAIAPVVVLSPGDAKGLLEVARSEPLGGLRQAAERIRARVVGEAAGIERQRRVHERRYCRTYRSDDGGLRLDALLGALDGAAVAGALRKETERLWRQACKEGLEPSFDQLRADALVGLVSARSGPGGHGSGPGGHGSGPGGHGTPEVLVHVDAEALVRGHLEGEERCEIQGVGPVPIESARQLLGEGFFTLVVHDGQDIKTVTSTKRAIPRKVRMALLARDEHCVVPGCAASEHLETDHWRLDFQKHGPTELDNLCRLCVAHHRMKTRTGWRIVGGPGKWRWLPPRPRRVVEPRAGP